MYHQWMDPLIVSAPWIAGIAVTASPPRVCFDAPDDLELLVAILSMTGTLTRTRP